MSKPKRTGKDIGALKKLERANKPVFSRPKRSGAMTKVEGELIAKFVADQKQEITTKQERALATLLNRPTRTIKEHIEAARAKFVANGESYAEIHMLATQGALATMDFEVAGKLSQYALSNLSGGGQRVVEKAENAGPQGAHITVGVHIGGVKRPLESPVIAITPLPPAIEGEVSAK